jgi:hypothetical protein
MARKLLLATLAAALLIETAFTAVGFLAPRVLLAKFGMAAGPDALFLAFVLSWTLGFVSLVCALALKWVAARDPQGWTWSFILGTWWIGIGAGIYFYRGIPDNLLLDSFKGLLLVVFAWRSRSEYGG